MLLSKIFWRPIMGGTSSKPLYLTNVIRSQWNSVLNEGVSQLIISAAAGSSSQSYLMIHRCRWKDSFESEIGCEKDDKSLHTLIFPSLFTCCLGMFFVDRLPHFVYGCPRSCVWVTNSQAFITEFLGFEKFT